METDELRKHWENEDNWGRGRLGAYFCKQDPRLFVHKRGWPGGTINMAHSWAVPVIILIMLGLVALVVAVALAGAAR